MTTMARQRAFGGYYCDCTFLAVDIDEVPNVCTEHHEPLIAAPEWVLLDEELDLGLEAQSTTTVYRRGAELVVGDVIDYTPAGFQIARFSSYDSPLISVTGRGRVAYRHDGATMAVYDNHPVRIRLP